MVQGWRERDRETERERGGDYTATNKRARQEDDEKSGKKKRNEGINEAKPVLGAPAERNGPVSPAQKPISDHFPIVMGSVFPAVISRAISRDNIAVLLSSLLKTIK